ncbi:hypothetical protein GCM10009550_44150 [Actinocorallia libanotica]|uniref:Uncharacterized protein n=1 Tax=Actinocorallia libanotica TaxID=46162 RepID=A0ABN1RH70_9ACTN
MVPGANSGSISSIRRIIQSQSACSCGVIPSGIHGIPARWLRTSRTVVASLPFAPNSGQYAVTGAA